MNWPEETHKGYWVSWLSRGEHKMLWYVMIDNESDPIESFDSREAAEAAADDWNIERQLERQLDREREAETGE